MNTFPTKISELNRSDLPSYTRVGGNDTGWLNSDDTPLNAENLNKGDIALYHLLSETDGYLYKLISTLNSEINARESDDSTLATRILDEATARSVADTTLTNRISDEEDKRYQEDAKLQNNINSEADTRYQEDKQLRTDLTTEQKERSNADDELSSSIKTEKQYREEAVNDIYSEISKLSESITKSIDNLKSLLQGVDESIKTDLQTEIERATKKESEILQSAILDKDSISITCGSSTENI